MCKYSLIKTFNVKPPESILIHMENIWPGTTRLDKLNSVDVVVGVCQSDS